MHSIAETGWITEPKNVIGKLCHLPLDPRTTSVSKAKKKSWPTHFEGLVFKELHVSHLDPSHR